MPRLLLLNHVILLLCASIYLGAGIFLGFFMLPLEPKLTVDNYYMLFVEPVTAATHFFTYMTILMLICGVIMLATEWLSGLRWPPAVLLLGVIAATVLTETILFPLNTRLAAHITDPAALKTLFHQWANLNRVRISLWVIQWIAMAYWFYRMAWQARADR
jgi:hypothetical protein